MPSLTALRAFSVVAETRNVSKAGQVLNVTHAAISQQIRALEEHLDVKLIEGEQGRAWSSGTTNIEAWEYFRQAAHGAVNDVNPGAKSPAKELLEKALKLDPTYAIAWVMLGWIYQQYADVASLASDPDDVNNTLGSMLDCAQKAIDADPYCADAYSLMAMYYLEIKNFDQALQMAEKAVSLAPDNAECIAEASMVMAWSWP